MICSQLSPCQAIAPNPSHFCQPMCCAPSPPPPCCSKCKEWLTMCRERPPHHPLCPNRQSMTTKKQTLDIVKAGFQIDFSQRWCSFGAAVVVDGTPSGWPKNGDRKKWDQCHFGVVRTVKVAKWFAWACVKTKDTCIIPTFLPLTHVCAANVVLNAANDVVIESQFAHKRNWESTSFFFLSFFSPLPPAVWPRHGPGSRLLVIHSNRTSNWSATS